VLTVLTKEAAGHGDEPLVSLTQELHKPDKQPLTAHGLLCSMWSITQFLFYKWNML
jgi:hypothetical protein